MGQHPEVLGQSKVRCPSTADVLHVRRFDMPLHIRDPSTAETARPPVRDLGR